MKLQRLPQGALALVFAVAAAPSLSAQQCPVSASSNEGKLLAFYTAPIAFAPLAAPAEIPAGSIRIGGELTYVPSADSMLRESQGNCGFSKSENTNLSHVFPRPRVLVGLGGGLALEVSYLPPITVASATPNLGSAALSWTREVGSSWLLMLRAHGTAGTVSGSITCPASAFQTTSDTLPCFNNGSTKPSDDAFHPLMYGGEGAVGWGNSDGTLRGYVGGGITGLQPSLRVNFTTTRGGQTTVDSTNVKTTTSRGVVFAGATARVIDRLWLSAQLYSVPADLTTVRVSAAYDLR